MRRSRRLRLADLPRLSLRILLEVAALFGGRYRRTEGAHVLVRDDDGRILVVRTTYLGPGWMLPGGRVERDETPHGAAVREAREETGIDVRIARLLLIDAHRRHNVSFVFGASAVGGTLQPQLGEIAEVGWLTRAEIAATSWRLDRLLGMLDGASDGVVYVSSVEQLRAAE
jgi:ADP-ribose pyrophosphatase YjhB (NUDIX family)